jgi:thioredoxin reductase
MFDVLIIGGGVSGISCALVLGSAKIKILQPIKRLAFSPIKIIITTGSCFNNAYGIPAGSLGSDLLVQSTKHLSQLYLILLKYQKKILRIEGQSPDFTVTTNKNTYKSKIIVVAIGAANTFQLMG